MSLRVFGGDMAMLGGPSAVMVAAAEDGLVVAKHLVAAPRKESMVPMNKFALSFISLSLILSASSALAQNCPPGSLFCASGSVNVGVQFGTQPPPPPPGQVIVVQQPPPPPPVYIVQRPRPVVVEQPQVYAYNSTTVAYQGFNGRGRAMGVGAFAAGLGFGSRSDGASGMGGFGGTMRFRTHPLFAGELSIAGMVGSDYNADTRTEVPVTVSGIFYFNPQNRFQVYGVAGIGVSWAGVTYTAENARARGVDTATYAYFGGLGGLGAEWQLTPNFSIFGDARIFVRSRIDAERRDNPEFSRVNSAGRTETTNVSAGVVGQVGGIFYF
jgi:hypothetical protein